MSSGTSKARTLKMPTKKRREFLDKATKAYAAEVDQVAPYLESRGILPDTAKAWKLGYVADPLPGHEDFKGRLAIPYLSPAGTLGFKFRCVDHDDCKTFDCIKYLGEPGDQPRIFGVWNFRHDTPTMALCEGELDAIVATQVGVRAVAFPGASHWCDWWAHLFEGYDEVVLLRDGDKAGRAMAETLMGRLPNLRAVGMPEGEDVSSLVAKLGGDALIERMTA